MALQHVCCASPYSLWSTSLCDDVRTFRSESWYSRWLWSSQSPPKRARDSIAWPGFQRVLRNCAWDQVVVDWSCCLRSDGGAWNLPQSLLVCQVYPSAFQGPGPSLACGLHHHPPSVRLLHRSVSVPVPVLPLRCPSMPFSQSVDSLWMFWMRRRQCLLGRAMRSVGRRRHF
jgi:hypothetical protein